MGLERLVPDLEGIRILSLGQRKRLKVLQQVTISDVALGRSLCLLGGRVPVLSLSCPCDSLWLLKIRMKFR